MGRATAAGPVHAAGTGTPRGRDQDVVPALGEPLPRLPRVYVRRTELWERLDEATTRPVTLLVGPMGAGKTLGVSGWARHSGAAGGVRWLHGDPNLGPDLLARALNDAVTDSPDGEPRRLLVVDDAHLLPPTSLHYLDERLEQAPDSMRLLLLARWDLPITRLGPQLLGHLTVLRGELLRLSRTESATLVAEHARSDSPEVARIIADRTEGWCAAVVMSARVVGACSDRVAAARRLELQDTVVADGVASEVFASLLPRERHLLLCTAHEEIVTVETAAHLSRNYAAGQILTGLETTGLLVTCIGSEPSARAAGGRTGRYRIHPLMAEVVRRRILAGGVDVDRAAATVARAVRLDVARGETRSAFRRLVAMNRPQEAAELLATSGHDVLLHRDHAVIREFARRFPETVDASPATWFCLALERWFNADVAGAGTWMDRLLTDVPAPDRTHTPYDAQIACVRVMRSRLGLEPPEQAVATAQELVAGETTQRTAKAVLTFLLGELGVTQAWLGRLDDAEADLTSALLLSRAWDMQAYAVITQTHLASVRFLQGRETAARLAAAEALGMVERGLSWRPRLAEHRARLFAELSTLARTPRLVDRAGRATRLGTVHPADLTVAFWLRMRDAQVALLDGSVMGAEAVLESPADAPPLPGHARAVLLVTRGTLAALAGDLRGLDALAVELAALGYDGEAALLHGLRADVVGDRRAAADAFTVAAATVRLEQPPCRPLALACEAELRDALGDDEVALDRLRSALTATEVRRNAVPFLGWTRHGTPVQTLLARLRRVVTDDWLDEVYDGLRASPGLTSYVAPRTASVEERRSVDDPVVRPVLSPRERDVLRELARGATYADIARLLFVSENTVKTHVSSLYTKLAVNRRSEALALARSLDLL